jgi:hypothetical protein
MPIPKAVKFRRRGPHRFVNVPEDLRKRANVLARTEVDVIELEEWWYEVLLAEEWTAAYRVMQQGGFPVIAELRVFPRESDRMPGEWSGTYFTHASVPAGGITARLVKQLRPGDTRGSDLAEGREKWKKFIGLTGAKAHFRKRGFRAIRRPRQTGGRRGWTDDELLRAALFYVESTGTPVAELAKAWNLRPSQARDLLTAATRKGFLTAGKRGVKSRTLTDRAKALLKEGNKR